MPCRPRLVDEVLGACESRSVRGDRRLPGGVAPLAHGSEGAAGGDCPEEAVSETKFTLDDEGDDVVREMARVRPEMRPDDARLALGCHPTMR
jgi:hypothetical protein